MTRNLAVASENPERLRVLVDRLEAAGFQVLQWRGPNEAFTQLAEEKSPPSAIVYDWDLPEMDGRVLDRLAQLAQRHLGVRQLLFYPRPPDGTAGKTEDEPAHGLEKLNGVRIFYRPLSDPDAFHLIEETIGPAPVLSEVFPPAKSASRPSQGGEEAVEREPGPFESEEFLRRVGIANVPVLLHGETGVGKEVMARRLWSYSPRANKPFLKLNCAALPSELIESELFGYEKGAFTGATMDKPGKFELAQNGTILLDEIGDMDIRLQAKLLQVLQDGEVQPLGSSRIISVNVRVMAATHRDLRNAIEQGSFREDLYYRLSVINLTISPLRERRWEIVPLAEQFLRRHLSGAGKPPAITEKLRRAMLSYNWPGNVRELENVMRRFLVYQDPDLLAQELVERPQAFPESVEKPVLPTSASSPPPRKGSQIGSNVDSHLDSDLDPKIDYLARASREAESKLLLETLEAVRWNRRQAADRLNVDYKAFLYKLQKHGIVEGKAKRKSSSA